MRATCGLCQGRGSREIYPGSNFECGACNGVGFFEDPCSACGGSGSSDRTCGSCNGTGSFSAEAGDRGGHEGDRLSRRLGIDAATLDHVQTGLDAIGLFPLLGEPADGVSALLSLARGDYMGAGLSAASMVPLAGWGSAAAKWLRKLEDVPADSLMDGDYLRGLATAATDAKEATFYRQLAEVVDDAAARGRASPAVLDVMLRKAGENADEYADAVATQERTAIARRREIAEGLGKTSHDARTAGTGGVWESHSGISNRNELVVTINGEILNPVRQQNGKIKRYGLEKQALPDASNVEALQGRGYDRAHLWGPQFGDEAAAGVMYAPKEFNRGMQRVLEDTLRGMPANLREGERLVLQPRAKRLVLQARATSFPRDQFGGASLRTAEYDFGVVYSVNGKEFVRERVGLVFDLKPPGVSGWSHRAVDGGLVWR